MVYVECCNQEGISDEECLHLIKTRDETFVDPKAKAPGGVKAAQKPVSRLGLIPSYTQSNTQGLILGIF